MIPKTDDHGPYSLRWECTWKNSTSSANKILIVENPPPRPLHHAICVLFSVNYRTCIGWYPGPALWQLPRALSARYTIFARFSLLPPNLACVIRGYRFNPFPSNAANPSSNNLDIHNLRIGPFGLPWAVPWAPGKYTLRWSWFPSFGCSAGNKARSIKESLAWLGLEWKGVLSEERPLRRRRREGRGGVKWKRTRCS